MTYIKNGGFIRLVADSEVERYIAMGFIPVEVGDRKEAQKKSSRSPKKEKSHGGA